MTHPLYCPLPQRIIYAGKQYPLRPSFDRVLEVFDVFGRPDWDEEQRLEYAIWLLAPKARKLSIDHKAHLMDQLYKLMLNTKNKLSSGPKSIDFLQDAPYIYAGFRQAYGIDLYDEQGKLHWLKFLALFRALPENTRIMEIVSIRTRPIPKRTKYNAEEIRALMRAKETYRLEISQAERDTQLVQGLRSIASVLEGMSRGKS